MNLPKFYNTLNDNQWYQFYLDHNIFIAKESNPNQENFSIVIPPPNVTGVLHMGHCLNNTIQDILVRHAKLSGKNICWVPGTDHASIATEAKVLQMLKTKGILKSQLTRTEFLKHAYDWKNKYGNIILEQFKKLGCSLDWSKTAFTMDDTYSKMVIKVFVQLYEEGLIYRDFRMVHWDVIAQTALSDEEVIHKEQEDNLYFINYSIFENPETSITIATVRPETIMGDVAIAVNPNDNRYLHLIGKHAIVPLIHKKIPIIADDYVDPNFGTGALKITPGHDTNDFNIGKKHNLPIPSIFHDNGTLNQEAQIYIGLDRLEVRQLIVEDLKPFLNKVLPYKHQIGFSERTGAIVEPKLSLQWFLKMPELAQPALEAVLNQDIKFYPEKYINLYKNWLENIRDWCISRQLWWGHQIPAWYDQNKNIYVGESLADVHKKYPETTHLNLTQDDDCLDTWFSSWLWPIEVFKGISEPHNKNFNAFYPTSVLVTAPEIIFFWVARMVMSGIKITNQLPFKNVYFTGIVRDKIGRKMSKSLGNSPDLLQLIETNGSDAVRFGIMISSPAGNDLLFDEKYITQGKEFINKLWNALKLLEYWYANHESEAQLSTKEEFAHTWFQSYLCYKSAEITQNYAQFKLSENLKLIYGLIWNDFCSWYLEILKPNLSEKPSFISWKKTIDNFELLLLWLHPYLPFITEEIRFQLYIMQGFDKNSYSPILNNTLLPTNINPNMTLITLNELYKYLVTQIRLIKQQNQFSKDTQLSLYTLDTHAHDLNIKILEHILDKLVHISKINIISVDEAQKNNQLFKEYGFSISYEGIKFYLVSSQKATNENNKQKLKDELTHQEQFLRSLELKLNNPNFLNHAKPQVIELENKKKNDTQIRIKNLLELINS